MTAPARSNPHLGGVVLTAGVPLSEARRAVILIHGRGATAESILELAEELETRQTAYLAPQADGNTWYPYPFLVPTGQNEPWLSSAIEAVDRCVGQVEAAGLSTDRLVLLGFSQGACLALEYAARHPHRYGGLVGLSGGLIGSDAEVEQRTAALSEDAAGSPLAGTPVFMGCSDVDPHIPSDRFVRSARILEGLGAQVTARLYPGMGHTVNMDELQAVQRLIEGV